MKKILSIAFAGVLLTMTACQKETIQLNSEIDTEQISNELNIPPTNNIPFTYPNTIKTTTTINPPSDLSLLQYLKGETDYSIFYQSMYRTGLDIDIADDGPFTIFVPSNEAFQTFFANNNWTDLDDIPQNILTMIVKFHVANVEVKIDDLETGTMIPLFLTGKEMYINLDDPSNPFLVLGMTKADFIERDLVHTNGIVQKINRVLEL